MDPRTAGPSTPYARVKSNRRAWAFEGNPMSVYDSLRRPARKTLSGVVRLGGAVVVGPQEGCPPPPRPCSNAFDNIIRYLKHRLPNATANPSTQDPMGEVPAAMFPQKAELIKPMFTSTAEASTSPPHPLNSRSASILGGIRLSNSVPAKHEVAEDCWIAR